MASILVKDTGTAKVATKVVTYEADTVEIQVVTLCDGVTPDNQILIDGNKALLVNQFQANTLTSVTAVGVTTSATLIKAATSTRKKITLQNYTDAGTNPAIYIGSAGVTTGSGIAMLDGDSRVFENTDAIYGIVGSGSALIRILEETVT